MEDLSDEIARQLEAAQEASLNPLGTELIDEDLLAKEVMSLPYDEQFATDFDFGAAKHHLYARGERLHRVNNLPLRLCLYLKRRELRNEEPSAHLAPHEEVFLEQLDSLEFDAVFEQFEQTFPELNKKLNQLNEDETTRRSQQYRPSDSTQDAHARQRAREERLYYYSKVYGALARIGDSTPKLKGYLVR